MNRRLAKIEARVERLIEGGLVRLFRGRVEPHVIAARLARAVEDSALPSEDGRRIAVATYHVALHPADAADLSEATGEIAAQLEAEVVRIARDFDLVLAGSPSVHVAPDKDVPPHSVRVTPVTGIETGNTMNAPAAKLPKAEGFDSREYVIVDGRRQVPLDKPVINIGRQRDNQIILEHPDVSRRHAQLRRRYGRWVLYDLGSTAGTRLNDHPVTESVLTPGDVITLAGVQLIYASEDSSPRSAAPRSGMTRPLAPHAPQE